jgi:hypothetical protein
MQYVIVEMMMSPSTSHIEEARARAWLAGRCLCHWLAVLYSFLERRSLYVFIFSLLYFSSSIIPC